ncbi:MAG: hypothetical protein QMB94_05575 [Phycisphaerales bacterium]
MTFASGDQGDRGGQSAEAVATMAATRWIASLSALRTDSMNEPSTA